MAYGAGGAAAAAARAAAIANAIKASGAIVSMDANNFISILLKSERPLVVMARGGFLRTHYEYLTPYKGLVFYLKSARPIMLPGEVELITADKVWVPG